MARQAKEYETGATERCHQLFRQEMLLVYLQLFTNTEFAHRLQQRDDCFKNKPLRAPLFVLPAQQDFDLTVALELVGSADVGQQAGGIIFWRMEPTH